MKRIVLLISLLLVTVGLLAQTAIEPELGDGSVDHPYQIATWQNLYWISAPGTVDDLTQEQRWTKCYIQTADITFPQYINTWDNGAGWIPLGYFFEYFDGVTYYVIDEPFSGRYNGNNKTISGLYINRPSKELQGLFGFTRNAHISNIKLLNVDVISNYKGGGLVGKSDGGEVVNCYVTGNVRGTNCIGGLVGDNSSGVSNCYSGVNVRTGEKGGSLIGNSETGSINNCYSTGNVIGNNYIGGLAGVLHNCAIINCFSTGNTTGTGVCVGGFAGSLDNTTVSGCYSTGYITGVNNTGGLAGQICFSSITNCFSISNTTALGDYVGGLAGHVLNSTIKNCYSTGSITATNNNVGGLTGDNQGGAILDSFWDINTSGQTTSAGGSGKTTAEMKTQSTYLEAGWDFYTIWEIDSSINNGYPYLAYPNSVPNNDNTTITSMTATLHAAYPNPFNPSTTLSFDVTSNENVAINIYNVKGQLVKNICNQVYNRGYHSIIWNGKDNNCTQCSTGVYFYRMQVGKTIQTKKMMMVK